MIIFNQVSRKDIQNLSFCVKTGEMVSIYDENREVLQTIFNLIYGNEKADKGTIRYLEQGNYSVKPADNSIGFVFNDDILLPTRTIKETLKYIMRIKGVDLSCSDIRLRRIIEIVDIKYLSNKLPAYLLPHQKVRANIAQAILNYPPLIVLEDPLAGLDQVNAQGIIHLLKKLNRFSMTVLLLNSRRDIILGKEVRSFKLNNNYPEKKKGYYA